MVFKSGVVEGTNPLRIIVEKTRNVIMGGSMTPKEGMDGPQLNLVGFWIFVLSFVSCRCISMLASLCKPTLKPLTLS